MRVGGNPQTLSAERNDGIGFSPFCFTDTVDLGNGLQLK
jgi:hypothetical protein